MFFSSSQRRHRNRSAKSDRNNSGHFTISHSIFGVESWFKFHWKDHKKIECKNCIRFDLIALDFSIIKAEAKLIQFIFWIFNLNPNRIQNGFLSKTVFLMIKLVFIVTLDLVERITQLDHVFAVIFLNFGTSLRWVELEFFNRNCFVWELWCYSLKIYIRCVQETISFWLIHVVKHRTLRATKKKRTLNWPPLYVIDDNKNHAVPDGPSEYV